MIVGRLGTFAGIAFLLLAAPVVSAQEADATDHVAAARQAAGELNHKQVIASVTAALEQPGRTRDELIELYKLSGIAYGSRRKSDEATEAFKRLLALSPEFQLAGGYPPKIRRPFQEAGGFLFDNPKGLTLEASGPSVVKPGTAVSLSARLDDRLGMASKLELRYEVEGQERIVEKPAASSVTFAVDAADVPAQAEQYVLRLQVRALSANAGELSTTVHETTVEAPVVVEPAVTPPPVTAEPTPQPVAGLTSSGVEESSSGGPVYKKWWFWTAAGVAVAAVGTGTYFLTRDSGGIDLSVTMEVAE